jgi:predicted DNA-binding protein with PD1-like motif
MRLIQHPGPSPSPSQRRVESTPTGLQAFSQPLAPGQSLLDAVSAAFAAQGATSGVARLQGGVFDPWPYVMPALSRSPAHAVYFSERHEARGPVHLQEATITFGRRGGQPWLHAHVDWLDAEGRAHCGHVLPNEARLVDGPARLDGWALSGSGFEVQPDAETNFSLFRPVAVPGVSPAGGDAPALAVRVPQNVDLCEALEALCRAQGWPAARVRGGVGSTVGVAFDDGRVVEPFVTETLIRAGEIRPDARGELRAAIDVMLVDHLGGRHQGRLARGENGVLVTFELLLERG